jgi:hypothetical protein
MTAGTAQENALWLPPDHPTSTVFLDETGLLRRDRYFGIGILKLADASVLMRQLQRLRDQYDFHDELHWAGFDKAAARARPRSVEFAKAVIDVFFEVDDAHFCCHIADRQGGDITAQFRGHRHAGELAYERLASAVLGEVVGKSEVVSVLADRRSTSPAVAFERQVLRSVNDARERLAVASVCRIDSRSTDALQAVDLLLGAAAFDLRRGDDDKESQKRMLLMHLLDRCDCASFRPGGREDPTGRWKVKLLVRPSKTRRKNRGG